MGGGYPSTSSPSSSKLTLPKKGSPNVREAPSHFQTFGFKLIYYSEALFMTARTSPVSLRELLPAGLPLALDLETIELLPDDSPHLPPSIRRDQHAETTMSHGSLYSHIGKRFRNEDKVSFANNDSGTATRAKSSASTPSTMDTEPIKFPSCCRGDCWHCWSTC